MAELYESMFLLDNDTVRANWNTAKSIVTDALEKYGGEVLTARRFDERRLAYPIKGHKRATYLLTFGRIPAEGLVPLRRDLELDERVLRYLILRADEVPAKETELSQAELAEDFAPPVPPADDEPPPPTREQRAEPREGEAPAEAAGEKPAEAKPAEAAGEKPAEAAEAKPDEAAEADGEKSAEAAEEKPVEAPPESTEPRPQEADIRGEG